MTEIHTEDRLLARAEVERRVGMGRSALYRAMREKRFPEPLKIGPSSFRWSSREIETWVASLERSHGAAASRGAA